MAGVSFAAGWRRHAGAQRDRTDSGRRLRAGRGRDRRWARARRARSTTRPEATRVKAGSVRPRGVADTRAVEIEPASRLLAVARGAVPIATRVVAVLGLVAAVALAQMSAAGGGATGGEVVERTAMRREQTGGRTPRDRRVPPRG